MQIEQPTVGPIVGYTSANEARVFIRGEVDTTSSKPRRYFGALQWRKPGGAWSQPLVNKLSPTFDGSCVFAVRDLDAGQPYEYRAGWFQADADLQSVQPMLPLLSWPEQPSGAFTTGTTDPGAARSYAVGSCRYLLKLFGNWFDDRGDKVFESILQQHRAGALHGVVMAGDQIYADDMKGLGQDRSAEDFFERYRAVFSQEHIARLMANVPTYMILDDHEIENNWPAGASQDDRLVLYPNAIHAYQVYQCSHSPVFASTPQGRIDGTPEHFWYQFRDGCADWFVMDTRTERVLQGPERGMVNRQQMDALLAWLKAPGQGVKMVVSSVPLFPDFASDRGDKWQGFSQQRDEILTCIAAHGVQRVVFVSGDVHCSFVARMQLTPDTAVHSLVSSSFFWPYPHTALADLSFDQPLKTAIGGAPVPKLMSGVHRTDNFARVAVKPGRLDVEFYGRKGELLEEVGVPL